MLIKEIIVYKMLFNQMLKYKEDIICVPFQEKYWNKYMKIYNEYFYKMRNDLKIEGIHYY